VKRVERWIFQAGSAERLAAIRIGLCLVVAYRIARPVYRGLAHQPPALYRPLSFMKLLPHMPPEGAVVALQVAGVIAALLAAAGIRSRIAFPAAWGCSLILNGMFTSIGKVVHNDVLLLLCMVPLLAAPIEDAWALAPSRRSLRRRRDANRARDVRYGWPLRVAMIVIAGAYFLTGFQKVVNSGPGWVTSGNLRWVLYTSSDGQPSPNTLGLWLAGTAWAAHLFALFTLVVELGFPLVLWTPRAAWFFVPAAFALHLGILLTMHLDYITAHAFTVVIVFVNWPAVFAKLSRAPAGAPVVAPTG
jgi:hypothetical protein